MFTRRQSAISRTNRLSSRCRGWVECRGCGDSPVRSAAMDTPPLPPPEPPATAPPPTPVPAAPAPTPPPHTSRSAQVALVAFLVVTLGLLAFRGYGAWLGARPTDTPRPALVDL